MKLINFFKRKENAQEVVIRDDAGNITEVIAEAELHSSQALPCWKVEWRARHDAYSSSTRMVAEFFTNKQAAKDFRDALKAAFKLVQNTSEASSVTLTKSTYMGI